MAWTVFNDGDVIHASHVAEIQNALAGVAGAGQAISLTQLNSSTGYALDVQNLDSTNGYGFRVRDEANNTIIDAVRTSLTLGKKVVMTGLGTYSAAANLFDIAATWSNAGATFNGIKLNVTNTNSAAASRLLDLQVGSTSVFGVSTGGGIVGLVSKRQGGSATVWSTNGTTDYTPGTARIQVGVIRADGGGTVTVTFGTAFSYAPVITFAGVAGAGAIVPLLATVSATGFTANAGALQDVHWAAIGPQ